MVCLKADCECFLNASYMSDAARPYFTSATRMARANWHVQK